MSTGVGGGDQDCAGSSRCTRGGVRLCGVGLSVIQGARIAGAQQIIAVDLSEEKMALAREFGATDTIAPGGSPAKEIMAMTGGIGVDYAFEVVGLTRPSSRASARCAAAAPQCW